jgi:TRAP transporter TAXI family solute receptor
MEQHIQTIFKVLGISFDRFIPLHMGFAEGADALIAGEIDVQFHPPIPNAVLTQLSHRADIRVIPFVPAQLEKLFAEVPFYRPVTVEKDAFRGVVEDIIQVGVVNVIVSHESVDQSAVYSMAKTIADNLDKLPQMNALFKGMRNLFEPLRSQGAAAFEFGGVPLHPGALKAYRDAGWLN